MNTNDSVKTKLFEDYSTADWIVRICGLLLAIYASLYFTNIYESATELFKTIQNGILPYFYAYSHRYIATIVIVLGVAFAFIPSGYRLAAIVFIGVMAISYTSIEFSIKEAREHHLKSVHYTYDFSKNEGKNWPYFNSDSEIQRVRIASDDGCKACDEWEKIEIDVTEKYIDMRKNIGKHVMQHMNAVESLKKDIENR